MAIDYAFIKNGRYMKVIKIKSNHIESAFWFSKSTIRIHLIFIGITYQYNSGYFAVELQLPYIIGIIIHWKEYKYR